MANIKASQLGVGMVGRLIIDQVTYRTKDGQSLLSDFSLDTAGAGRVGLVGRTGIGKTTVFRLLAGLVVPMGGKIHLDGKLMQFCKIGYCPQDRGLMDWLSVRDNVGFAMEMRRNALDQFLNRFQLGAIADKLPGEISGGEQARCAIARSLICAPDILLLDEPFTGLDVTTRALIMKDLIEEQQRGGFLVLLVTHTPEEVVEFCESVFLLSDRPVKVNASFAVSSGRSSSQKAAIVSQMRVTMGEP